jgi:hypothetical protein
MKHFSRNLSPAAIIAICLIAASAARADDADDRDNAPNRYLVTNLTSDLLGDPELRRANLEDCVV